MRFSTKYTLELNRQQQKRKKKKRKERERETVRHGYKDTNKTFDDRKNEGIK